MNDRQERVKFLKHFNKQTKSHKNTRFEPYFATKKIKWYIHQGQTNPHSKSRMVFQNKVETVLPR